MDTKDLSSSFFSKVNVTPSSDFTPGTAINVQLTVGNEYNKFASSLPSHLTENPASFGLELKVKSEDKAAEVVVVLTQVKEMIGAMVPGVEDFYNGGVVVNFRTSGTSVFVDVSLGGAFGEKVTGILSKYNFSSVNFTGASQLQVTSKLSPVDILGFNLTQLVEEVSNLKIEYSGEYSHLKNIITFGIDTLTAVTGGNIPKKLKPVVFAVRFAEVIRKLDFNFQYDSSVVQEIVKDTFNSMGSAGDASFYETVSNGWTSDKQPKIQETIDQVSSMGAMFLEPYKPALLDLNLENITLYATSPSVRAYAKVNLAVRGASDFVAKILG